MPTSPTPHLPVDAVNPGGLLHLLFSISLSGIMLARPCYNEQGTIADFALAHLNPAAQRMLGQPECPGESFLTLFPTAEEAGVFGFYCEAFLSGQVAHRQNNYQFDGLDGYYLLAAQRHEDLLVVSFTDTNDQPRTAVKAALRESQVREQAALVEAERQRGELARVFELAPVTIAVYEGPEYRIELANPVSCQLLNRTAHELLGKPLFEALPELAGHGFEQVLASVYTTGQPVLVHEQPGTHERAGQLDTLYWNLAFLPMRAADGHITGALSVGIEVTQQLLARQQVQTLNEELAALNEELRASNEEYLQTNTSLHETKQQLQQLNQELEAARAATERERTLLHALIEQAPVPIALFQEDELYVASANAVIAKLWGYTPEQVIGRPLLEGVPELQGQGFDDLLRQVLHTQVPVTGTETPAVMLRDGQLYTSYYNFIYQPLYDAEDQVVGVLNVSVEVTEQVLTRQQVERLNAELESRVQERTHQLTTALAAAEQLRQQREAQQRELQNLFAQAPMAIVVLRGPRFIIEQANTNAEGIWGRTAAEVLGRPHFEALPDAAGQGFEELLTGVLQSGTPVVLREVPIELARSHSGKPNTGYYNIIFKPLFDEQQHATGIVMMWTETTDQVLARRQVQDLNEELAAINEELTATNEELHQSNTQLTRTNVDLDNFIYTASHDLKAPITNIEGLLLALEHELPAAGRTGDVPLMLHLMQDATERFRRTINHLTDLSRLQKEYSQGSEDVLLAPVVEAVRLDLGPLLAHTQGRLEVLIPQGLAVTFAEKNLRSVVYNLLSNALKYHHPDRPPEVRLRSWLAGSYAVLEVQDNGLGLDLSQEQERLFAMFQRLHTHVEGTGVGLYMVKRIVENAGGYIEVTSQLGQGSTFQIYFRR